MTPMAYHPDVERIAPDEQETFDRLSGVFRQVQEHVRDKAGEAKHGTHAKATALLKGALVIPGDLPAELAQGLFAHPGRYDALGSRLSDATGAADREDDIRERRQVSSQNLLLVDQRETRASTFSSVAVGRGTTDSPPSLSSSKSLQMTSGHPI